MACLRNAHKPLNLWTWPAALSRALSKVPTICLQKKSYPLKEVNQARVATFCALTIATVATFCALNVATVATFFAPAVPAAVGQSWEYIEDRVGDGEIENGRTQKFLVQDTET